MYRVLPLSCRVVPVAGRALQRSTATSSSSSAVVLVRRIASKPRCSTTSTTVVLRANSLALTPQRGARSMSRLSDRVFTWRSLAALGIVGSGLYVLYELNRKAQFERGM
jgi:hypothetical protein